jgi:hypothetical protein
MRCSDEVCRANKLELGVAGAILNGRWRGLTVVGIALSPEYIYGVGEA